MAWIAGFLLSLAVLTTCKAFPQPLVKICVNTSCRKANSLQTYQLFEDICPSNCKVETSGCLGRCGEGPNVSVSHEEGDEGAVYNGVVKATKAAAILELEGLTVKDSVVAAYSTKMLGDKAAKMGKASDAVASYNQALQCDLASSPRTQSSVLLGKGLALIKMQQRQTNKELLVEAEKTLRLALQAWEGNLRAWTALADALEAEGRGDEAAATLDEAIAAVTALGDSEAVGQLTSKRQKLEDRI
ncbi:unnamed protein product [Chrysoparadoxa australica]